MPHLRADLQFDYSQIGILLGVFMIANRLGDCRTIRIGLVALAIGGVILGSSDSFYGALAGRIISGFGAVFSIVSAAKILTDWFVGKEMPRR